MHSAGAQRCCPGWHTRTHIHTHISHIRCATCCPGWHRLDDDADGTTRRPIAGAGWTVLTVVLLAMWLWSLLYIVPNLQLH